MEYSSKIMEIAPSATLAITSKAKALKAAGEDVIILAAGEPDFDTPDVIKEAAIKAINSGDTKYTPAGGRPSLKEAICRKLKKDNGLDYSANEIVVSNGAKHSLYNVMQVILNPADEVLIVPPYWLSYPEMVKLAGGIPKILPMRRDNGFKISPGEIKDAAGDRTRALILNSPSNPAGVIYTADELGAIAEACMSAGILIISDEIYEKIVFDGKKHVSIAATSPAAQAATILVNGVSKSHSMTGWRIGYIAADSKTVKLVSTLQSHSTSNPCSISQAAAECALTTDLESDMARNREEFQGRRDMLLELLSGEKKLRPVKPEGAFYLFCDISGCGMDSMTFSSRLLEEKKVAVIPGGPFGDDDSVRISFATARGTIEEGVKRLVDWVSTL